MAAETEKKVTRKLIKKIQFEQIASARPDRGHCGIRTAKSSLFVTEPSCGEGKVKKINTALSKGQVMRVRH